MVARCATGCLHQHFGRQNTYRNNIFAHGEEYLVRPAPDDRRFSYDLEAFRRSDRDGHSVAADSKLADPGEGDFGLAEDSPVRALGFRPIDLSDVGPRR